MSESTSYTLPPLVPSTPTLPGTYDERTLERLRNMALALLPPGWAFTRRLGGVVATALEALMVEPARWHAELEVMRAHISPRRAAREDYLAAWEEAAGILPSGTIAQRAEAVALVIRGIREHKVSAYQAAAEALGFTWVGLEADATFAEADVSSAEDPATGDAWAYAFTARVAWGDAGDLPELEAALQKIKRAHTIVRVELVEMEG